MTPEEINYSLFRAAEHLLEAGKFMSNLSQEKSLKMFLEASAILEAVKPMKDKISQEKLTSVMDEIINFGSIEKC